jgi:hypothetical protein
MAVQPQWRFCHQCKVLYFDGHADGNKGACSGAPSGQQGHRPAGYNFVLPFNVPATPNSQNNWRNCWKCQAMYFDGHADGNKGKCPSGGAHEGHGNDPRTFNFVLPLNVPWTPTAQNNWRNCWKCQAMFFAGYPDKGRCAAGGAHEGHEDDPRTFNFVLPHPITPDIALEHSGSHVIVRGKGFTPNHDVTVKYQFRSGGGPTTTTQGEKVEGTNTDGAFTSEVRVTLTGAISGDFQVVDQVTGTDARRHL